MKLFNKYKLIKYGLIGILSLGVLIPDADSVSAASIEQMQQQEAATAAQISNLEKQTKMTQDAISALKSQKAATENTVNALKGDSIRMQDKVDRYTDKLENISGEIEDAQAQMAEVSSVIVDLSNDLEEAENQEKTLYKALKNQVRSSYMSRGKNGLISMLFEGNSFRSMLNNAKYVEAVVAYNQKKLSEYRQLQDEIKAKKEEYEARQEEIDDYQNSLDDKYNELETLTGEVMDQLDDTYKSIVFAENKVADFESELKSLDTTMKALEAKTAAAQAELAKQIAARQQAQMAAGQKEYTGGSYAASASELEWLSATIQAEAGGESYTGKLAVGSVIMNRVKSSSFPNSIVGVITQNLQFASYRSGKVELIMRNGAAAACVQAAKEVLAGARVGDYLFFMTKPYADKYGIKGYTMIGNHAFFYSWFGNNGGNGAVSKTEEASSDSPVETETPHDDVDTDNISREPAQSGETWETDNTSEQAVPADEANNANGSTGAIVEVVEEDDGNNNEEE